MEMEIIQSQNIDNERSLVLRKHGDIYRILILFTSGSHKGKEYGYLKPYQKLSTAKSVFTKALKDYDL